MSGWSGFFETAFKQSRNAMVLVDERRIQIDVNGAYLKLLGYAARARHRPAALPIRGGAVAAVRSRNGRRRWRSVNSPGRREMICADGTPRSAFSRGGHAEVVTGRRLVLFVALSTSRWGGQLPPHRDCPSATPARCRTREQEIVRLIALGEHRAGDRGRIADRARHRPHARPQLDDEDARPLAGPSRGEALEQRRRAGAEPGQIPQLRYCGASRAPATMRQCASRVGSTAGQLRGVEPARGRGARRRAAGHGPRAAFRFAPHRAAS